MASLNFKASQIDIEEFELIPTDWYEVTISDTQRKNAKSGDENAYLQIELTFTKGQYSNRKIWDILNLWNTSEKAVQYAEKRLASICNAVGLPELDRSEQLHGLCLKVRIGTEDNRNVIKRYKALSETTF